MRTSVEIDPAFVTRGMGKEEFQMLHAFNPNQHFWAAGNWKISRSYRCILCGWAFCPGLSVLPPCPVLGTLEMRERASYFLGEYPGKLLAARLTRFPAQEPQPRLGTKNLFSPFSWANWESLKPIYRPLWAKNRKILRTINPVRLRLGLPALELDPKEFY